jgi:hypothetical protein
VPTSFGASRALYLCSLSVWRASRRSLKPARRSLQVDQYLFLFLKFIAAVIPTMEYDYTLPADFS